MAKTIQVASAAALAALLIAAPALAQTTVIIPAAPTVITPVPTTITTVPERVLTYPVPTDTVVVEPRLSPVAMSPRHAPVSAVAGGLSPTDPAEYATNSPITVTGRIDGVVSRDGVTSFRLQTRTEAWTVVVPAGEYGRIGNGRSATVTGYPHVDIRNQLLAQSVTAG